MFDHDAFGRAGGAGGENNIGKRIGGRRGKYSYGNFSQGNIINGKDFAREVVDIYTSVMVAEEDYRRATLFDNIANAPFGIAGVNGNITGSGLGDRHHADRQFHRALRDQRHGIAGPNPFLFQARAQCAAGFIQLTVGQMFIIADDGGFFRITGSLLDKIIQYARCHGYLLSLFTE